MAQQQVYIVDVINDIVNSVSTKLSTQLQTINPTITGVHYLYGHAVEIKRRLQEKSEGTMSKFDKYPLIALFQDFVETIDNEEQSKCKLQLIICYHSEHTENSEDRYTKVFKPMLYLIYNEFIEQLKIKPYISYKNFFPKHEKIDRPHFGNPEQYGNDAYIFTDVVDAIEIRNLEIMVDKTMCTELIKNI